MKKDSIWSTRLGVYIAALGSAVGLGNFWRFPFVVAENGGGAFVLIYVFIGLIVGVPLLTSELMLGRLTGKGILTGTADVLESYQDKSKHRWAKKIAKAWSYFTFLSGFLVLSYLLFVSSWVLYFLSEFIKSLFLELSYPPEKMFSLLKENFLYQLFLIFLNLSLILIVVVRGVEKQVERWVSFIVPFFVVLLLLLVVKSLSLNVSMQALKYFFYPDFSKLNLTSLSYALGQVMFTLSLGIGLTVSSGRYINPKFNLPLTSFRVAATDSTLSLFAGMLVFPLVLSGIYDIKQTSGPTLVFEAIPSFLLRIEYGKFYALALFLFLYISAIGACIGLFETLVSNLKDYKKNSHMKASLQVASVSLVLVMLPVGLFLKNQSFRFANKSLFELFDMVLVNLVMPLSCFVIVLLLLKFVSDSGRRSEFFGQNKMAEQRMYTQWLFAMKYIIPFIYLLTFSMLAMHFLGF